MHQGIHRRGTWPLGPSANASPNQDLESGDPEKDHCPGREDASCQAFVRMIIEETPENSPGIKWYLAYVTAQYGKLPIESLQTCLKGLPPHGHDQTMLFDLLTATCDILMTYKHPYYTDSKSLPSFGHIYNELAKKGLVQDRIADENHANQLLLMIINSLTMLCSPQLAPQTDELLPAHDGRYGQIKFSKGPLDKVLTNLDRQAVPCPSDLNREMSLPPRLDATFLSLDRLQNVVDVRIEWVDSLNHHLDFDPSHRVLKIFEYPTYCQLALEGAAHKAILVRLFQGHFNDEYAHISEDVARYPETVLRETLLSYHLIFGKKNGGFKYFRSRQLSRPAPYRDVDEGEKDPKDPLLRMFQNEYSKKNISEYLGWKEELIPGEGSPLSDWRFLGQKLSDLETFSRDQKISSLRKALYDRSDIVRMSELWLLIAIGVGGIFVGLVQILLSGLQIKYAMIQNDLQQKQLNNSH